MRTDRARPASTSDPRTGEPGLPYNKSRGHADEGGFATAGCRRMATPERSPRLCDARLRGRLTSGSVARVHRAGGWRSDRRGGRPNRAVAFPEFPVISGGGFQWYGSRSGCPRSGTDVRSRRSRPRTGSPPRVAVRRRRVRPPRLVALPRHRRGRRAVSEDHRTNRPPRSGSLIERSRRAGSEGLTATRPSAASSASGETGRPRNSRSNPAVSCASPVLSSCRDIQAYQRGLPSSNDPSRWVMRPRISAVMTAPSP